MRKVFGPVHSFWICYPARSAIIAFLYVAFLWIMSALLGIAVNFGPDEQYTGFISSPNWGPLYLVGLPFIVFFLALFFRLLESAILSVDNILIPQKTTLLPFSEKVFSSFRSSWKKYISPTCIALSIALVLAADFSDIFSPLGLVDSKGEKDWTTYGYVVNESIPDTVYFVFNFLAFFAEGLLAYIGLITIACATYPLIVFIKKSVQNEFNETANSSLGEHEQYKLQWKYDDAHGRCGLHKLDKVFITYVGIIGVAVAMSAVSVLKNKYTTGIDEGSIILIIAVGFLFPLSFLWIILPYWIKFPTKLPSQQELPPELRGIALPDPKPWPLGSERIAWGFLTFVAGAWGYLVIEGVSYFTKM